MIREPPPMTGSSRSAGSGHFGLRMTCDDSPSESSRFFGEALRQAGILIVGSVATVLILVFALGLIGIEAAYGRPAVGAVGRRRVHGARRPARDRPVRVRLHDGREGRRPASSPRSATMRITEEIDALEVMGMDSLGLPRHDPPARHLADAAVRLRARDGRRVRRVVHLVVDPGRPDLRRRLPRAVLEVPEPARPPVLRHQGHGRWRRSSCSSAATTATPSAAGRSRSGARPPRRWS